MSNNNDSNDDVLRQLKELQAKIAGGAAMAPMAPNLMGHAPIAQFGQSPAMMAPAMQPQAMPAMSMGLPGGLLVPVTIPTQEGDAVCYLQLGPEAAANPQQAIAQLCQAGWPVRVYGGGGRFGGQGGQGGQRFGGGGGYRRGYGNGGGWSR